MVKGCDFRSVCPALSNWTGHGFDYPTKMALVPRSGNRRPVVDPTDGLGSDSNSRSVFPGYEILFDSRLSIRIPNLRGRIWSVMVRHSTALTGLDP